MEFVISVTINLNPVKTYTICEETMAAGWSAIWVTDINGTSTVIGTYNPNANDATPQDLGNRCFDIGAGIPIRFILMMYLL